MISVTTLEECITIALARRSSLIERLASENTDCYRLFHGTQEGAPGVTIDRYGDLLLLQSFHDALPEGATALAARLIDGVLPGLSLIYNDRSAPGSRVRNRLSPEQQAEAERDHVATEHGVRFHVRGRHRGQDPWLFLDLRPTRKAVMGEASGKSVLNLFAYTCGTGVAAAVAGASRVVNVDFARSSLDVGTANAELNGVSDRTMQLVSDFFPAIRQFGGIRQPQVTRGRKLPRFPHVAPEQFDLVFLDPPPRSKSQFGVVDGVRDYQGVLKPTLATVRDGGVLYCTNNIARVDERDWHSILRRCVEKSGRQIRSLDVLRPGEDFPSRDNSPPLKVVRLGL